MVAVMGVFSGNVGSRSCSCLDQKFEPLIDGEMMVTLPGSDERD